MIHLSRIRKPPILRSFVAFVDSRRCESQPVDCPCSVANSARFYGRSRGDSYGEISRATRREARRKGQAALLEYLHSTRSLQFMDADSMSRNSPQFLERILSKVDYSENDVGRSVARFLRYNPINEFEPFFESLGLEASEYSCILPEDRMFLNDDDLLMENYHVLCEYVMPRSKIGKVIVEVPEVFRYDHGVLASKLRAFEGAGIGRCLIGKVVVSSPRVLMGNGVANFVGVLEVLGKGGIGLSWVEEHLPEKMGCGWSQVLSLVKLLLEVGYSEEQLCCLISQHPDVLFEGDRTLSVLVFLSKFGTPMNQACAVLFECRGIEVGKFLSNLRRCFVFFSEIDMEPVEIGRTVSSQPVLLGSCALKKTSTLLSRLKCGKVTLCEVVMRDPVRIRNWVIGSKCEPLGGRSDKQRSKSLKKKFLLDLGFKDDSARMEKAFKLIRGKGSELQDRFDCIVKAGLSEHDACGMIKACPQILNQSKEVIDMKIRFVVDDLGYPISVLLGYPKFLVRTAQVIKLRLSMYDWLRDEGLVARILSFSTVLNSSEELFVKQYVTLHPRGPELWKELKAKIYSS